MERSAELGKHSVPASSPSFSLKGSLLSGHGLSCLSGPGQALVASWRPACRQEQWQPRKPALAVGPICGTQHHAGPQQRLPSAGGPSGFLVILFLAKASLLKRDLSARK